MFKGKPMAETISSILKIKGILKQKKKKKVFDFSQSHTSLIPKRRRARKINYFDKLPNELAEKLLSFTVTHELKDIGNIKKTLVYKNFLAFYKFLFFCSKITYLWVFLFL